MNTEQQRAAFDAWYDSYDIRTPQDPFDRELARKAWDAAMQSQDREDAFCVWHNDPETDNSWDTSCRELFVIIDGTPTENGMRFCCYCGKPIQEAIDHAQRAEEINDADS